MSDIIERLSLVGPLQEGAHSDHEGMCVMEAVAYVAGEPWSDNPECACPVISAFLRSWNDALPDDGRNALLRPLIPRLIGTRATKEIKRRRAIMAGDWLIHVCAPAWLRLAGLTRHADALVSLPEITDFSQRPSLMPALNAAGNAAGAVRDADGRVAMAAGLAAARAAAGGAAREAAWAAAWDAAWAAVVTAAWDAARDAAWAAAGDAAWAAARDEAGAAARAALNATCQELQLSALRLVERMIET